MTNSAIIEVVIGLIFVYSLMSILVTQINTVIGNFLNLRAERLKERIEKLLTDPVIRAKILTHPLIGMVETKMLPAERITASDAQDVLSKEKAKVAYIAPETFVDVLTDVLTGGSTIKLYAILNQAVEALPTSIEKSEIRELVRGIQTTGLGLPALRESIKKLPEPAQRQSLLEALNLVEDALEKFRVDSSDLIPLMAGVKQIQDPYLQSALEAVLNTATTLKDAQVKLANWFDNNMQLASERFTREMQRFSLGVGLLLALILNVDTLQLSRTLWEDPALRQTVSVAASRAAPTTAQINQGEISESVQAARNTLQELLNLRLPIGWEWSPVEVQELEAISQAVAPGDGGGAEGPPGDGLITPEVPDTGPVANPLEDARNLWNYFPGNNPANWFGLVLKKLIGLFITMIAVAQGAPFWFDLLNRLTGQNQAAAKSDKG
jgi:hypothetical protein